MSDYTGFNHDAIQGSASNKSDKLDKMGGLEAVKADVKNRQKHDVYLMPIDYAEALIGRVERLERDNQEIAFENGRLKAANKKLERELHAEAVCDCHTWPTMKEFHAYTVAVEEQRGQLQAELEKLRTLILRNHVEQSHPYNVPFAECIHPICKEARECLKGQQ